MAIAFDAKSQLSGTFTTGFGSWTHTPVGTPAGVIVLITQGVADTDDVTSVTYGGIAMTRIAFDHQDGGGDPTAAYLYFLGEGVPSGAQTVAVQGNHRFATACVTVTADSGSTAVDVFNSGNGTANNPTLTLDYTDGLADWIALVCMADGAGAVSGANINTGTSLYENDLGAQVGMFSYIEGTGGTSQSFSTTANNASWAWCGAVIEELVVSNDVSVNAECPQISVVSNNGGKSVADNAGNSAISIAANNATKSLKSSAQNSVVALTANAPSSSIRVSAGVATVGLTANNSTPSVKPSTSSASLTVAVNNATESISVNAGVAVVAIVAVNPVSTVSPNSSNGVVSFVANDATATTGNFVDVFPDTPVVSVTLNDATKGVAVNAGVASVSFVANNVTANIASTATFAALAFIANNNTPSVSANAGVASITLTANKPGSGRTPNAPTSAFAAGDVDEKISVNAEASSFTVVANDGIISTSTNTNAPAGNVVVTVAANSPGKSVSVNAGVATVSVSAPSPAAALKAAAGPAAMGIVAPNAAASVVACAGVASIALSIDASTTKVGSSSGLSSVLWTSLDATIPVQFLGPPDLIIKKLSTSTIVNDKSNSVTCSAKTGVLTVTDLTNGLIIRKVDNTVTVNDN